MDTDERPDLRRGGESKLLLKTETEKLIGIATQDAVNMIVNGFCKEVFKELPMEFAVEAQKLLGVSLEGSVG